MNLKEKIALEIRKFKARQEFKKKINLYKKWFFIKSALIEYYEITDNGKLSITPEYRAKLEMENRIKTEKKLNYWFKKCKEWRKNQYKCA